MFFDNLTIHHNRGPILEETHYYPFGLTMTGISDQAILKPENRFKYDGIELNHKEFSDGPGWEMYGYIHRGYEPQLGRFISVDGLATKFPWWTPYQFAGDMPTKYVDLDGMEPASYDPQTQSIYQANAIYHGSDRLNYQVPEGNVIVGTNISKQCNIR